MTMQLSSCKTQRIKAKLQGGWIITELIYQDFDLVKCLNLNSIRFKKSEVRLPMTGRRCPGFEHFGTKGYWKVVKQKGQFYLLIQSENSLFEDEYFLLEFSEFEDPRLNDQLKIKSANLLLTCQRW